MAARNGFRIRSIIVLPLVTGDRAGAGLMVFVRKRALDARQGGLIEGKFANA
jgi:hypothetical protein